MKISANSFNLQGMVDTALANLQRNNPSLAQAMSWHDVTFEMSNRQKRAIGLCKSYRLTGRIVISFSASAFASMSEADRQDTVSHEMAHAICFRLQCGEGHDYRWAKICRDMGGDGQRTFKGEVAVKRNVVKRYIMARKSAPEKILIRTRKQADNLTVIYRDVVLCGVVSVSVSDKRVKWLSVTAEAFRSINPLGAGYKLEA